MFYSPPGGGELRSGSAGVVTAIPAERDFEND